MANTWKAKNWNAGVGGSWTTLSSTAGSYKTLTVGYGGTNNALEIAFTAVDGNYKTIALRLQNYWGVYFGSSVGSRTFRYKVLTVEDATYTKPTASTSYDGTILIGNGEYASATVTFTRESGFVKGNTYYIYVFAQDFSSTANVGTILWGKYDSSYYTAEVASSFVDMQGAVNVGSRKGTVKIYHNGQWRVGIPKVYKDGQWRIGG